VSLVSLRFTSRRSTTFSEIYDKNKKNQFSFYRPSFLKCWFSEYYSGSTHLLCRPGHIFPSEVSLSSPRQSPSQQEFSILLFPRVWFILSYRKPTSADTSLGICRVQGNCAGNLLYLIQFFFAHFLVPDGSMENRNYLFTEHLLQTLK